MKVKYIKPTHAASVGDIVDVQPMQARVLVKLGYAEVYKQEALKPTKPKRQRKPKKGEAFKDLPSGDEANVEISQDKE